MKIRIVFLLALLFIFSSCDTDDISPAVSLTASSGEISEDQGLTTITATLNSESNQEIIIPVTFSGTAIFGEDYISSESALIIPSGNISGSLSISSMQDNDIEDIETIIITIDSQSEIIVMTSSLTISILDDDADSDGDGINDSDDDCPNEAGIPEYNGCSQPLLILSLIHI